jgi:hypothetical protein
VRVWIPVPNGRTVLLAGLGALSARGASDGGGSAADPFPSDLIILVRASVDVGATGGDTAGTREASPP